MFPSIPAWHGIHPLLVHFPIALLLIAPLLVVMSLVLPKIGKGLAAAALTVMALGVIGAFLAVATGEAAAKMIADPTDEIIEAVEEHEELAETTRNVFTVLLAAYAAILVVPLARKKPFASKLNLSLNAAFLALYLTGMIFLANTGDRGGRLVHVLGVRAELSTDGDQAASQPDQGQK